MSQVCRSDPTPHTRWAVRVNGGNQWLCDHGNVGPVQHARLFYSLNECAAALAAMQESGTAGVIEAVIVYAPMIRPRPSEKE